MNRYTDKKRTWRKSGRTLIPFYGVWSNMKTRCYNENSPTYSRYGARGIRVCDRWLNDSQSFIDDMLPTYFKGATLDRINNNGDYSPENCRWATMKQQQNNRSSNRIVVYKGKRQTLEQWINELGLKSSTVRQRIYVYGWSLDKAFNTPVGKRRIVS